MQDIRSDDTAFLRARTCAFRATAVCIIKVTLVLQNMFQGCSVCPFITIILPAWLHHPGKLFLIEKFKSKHFAHLWKQVALLLKTLMKTLLTVRDMLFYWDCHRQTLVTTKHPCTFKIGQDVSIGSKSIDFEHIFNLPLCFL